MKQAHARVAATMAQAENADHFWVQGVVIETAALSTPHFCRREVEYRRGFFATEPRVFPRLVFACRFEFLQRRGFRDSSPWFE